VTPTARRLPGRCRSGEELSSGSTQLRSDQGSDLVPELGDVLAARPTVQSAGKVAYA
jgi:hypothetical protein